MRRVSFTKTRQQAIGVALILALTACSSASAIMDSYVGKPLTEPIFDYGPPSAAYVMEGDRKAFVWVMNNEIVVPGSVYTTGSAYSTGSMTTYSAQSTATPGYVASSSCSYVLFAKPNGDDVEGPSGWTVVDYREPRLSCE